MLRRKKQDQITESYEQLREDAKANVTRIEMDDEMRQSLITLHNDIEVLESLLREVSDKATQIVATLHRSAISAEPVEVGVKVFSDEEGPKQVPEDLLVPVTQHIDDADRIRATPFTRAPRSRQVEWLRDEVMTDGGWYSAIGIARTYAQDEKHFRYLRHAIGHRFREMHEESILQRRDSHVSGAMYEYKLRA